MTLTNSGRSRDLRETFPAMMAAAMEYLGQDTQKSISVTVKEKDPEVFYIKGLQPAQTVKR